MLLVLVLAIITASVAAWMKITGGDDGVADAELIDFGDFDTPAPMRNDSPARHALVTVAARHIPLNSVRQGPRIGQAWLHFADGTELLAEERALGALGLLAFDLVWHGPTPSLAISPTTQDSPDEDLWISVGRLRTHLRLLDAHHPDALAGI